MERKTPQVNTGNLIFHEETTRCHFPSCPIEVRLVFVCLKTDKSQTRHVLSNNSNHYIVEEEIEQTIYLTTSIDLIHTFSIFSLCSLHDMWHSCLIFFEIKLIFLNKCYKSSCALLNGYHTLLRDRPALRVYLPPLSKI